MKKKLFAVVGPTASGKTSLSINIAKHFKTTILSCDSRQFYKEMCVGTAVPTQQELSAIEHHFIQSISIHDEYSVGEFEEDALCLLDKRFQYNDYMVMCGGSGLYETALTKGLNNFPSISQENIDLLNHRLNQEGLISLVSELKEVDNETYQNIDLQNSRRIIRALSVYLQTGKPISFYKNQPLSPRKFDSIKVGISWEREQLYDRINKRVDLMIKNGLLDEAQKLYPYKNLQALNTIGYKELFLYFDNRLTKEEAIEEIKKNTRRFAKRQLTWYRKDENVVWFKPNELDNVIPFLEEKIT